MNQKNYSGFPLGFICGVVLSILCWNFLENVYAQFLNPHSPKIAFLPPGSPQPKAVLPSVKPEEPSAKPQPPRLPEPVVFKNLEASPSKGPASAKITLVEFGDFHCPFCARIAPTIQKIIDAYPGQVRRVWKHFPLSMHQGAEITHQASECARDQGKFWEFHDQVFTRQAELRNPGILDQIAQSLGLNQKAFDSCLESKKYAGRVTENMQEGSQLGVSGVPATFVNGIPISGAQPLENFKTLIEHLIDPAGHPLPQAPESQPRRPEPPRDPVQFTDLDGKPSQGTKDALVTLVEFSDFHCPFCSRSSNTMGEVMAKYPGKVKRVWRHYPLPMHQGAEKTHMAAECANEQGKFWEYHDQVFQHQGELQNPEALKTFAKTIHLKISEFEACLASGKYQARVREDIQKGNALGVQGTPATFVNGKLISGAVPYEQFAQAIDEAMKKK